MLLDPCCNANAIVSADMGHQVGLKTTTDLLCLTTLGHQSEGFRELADITLDGVNGFSLDVRNAVFGDIIGPIDDELPSQNDIKDLDHCKGITFERFPADDAEVEPVIGVILGSKYAWTWKRGEERFGGVELPIATYTRFGWTLSGPKSASCPTPLRLHNISAVPKLRPGALDPEIATLLEKQFEPVDEGATDLSVEDKFALKQLQDTVVWDPVAKRWRVGLPWVEGREHAASILNQLPSDQMSLDRLRRSTAKMRKDPVRKDVIFKQMKEFDDDGQVVDVDPVEHRNMPPDRPRWVVPTHIVDKPGKPGQVRVCHGSIP